MQAIPSFPSLRCGLTHDANTIPPVLVARVVPMNDECYFLLLFTRVRKKGLVKPWRIEININTNAIMLMQIEFVVPTCDSCRALISHLDSCGIESKQTE